MFLETERLFLVEWPLEVMERRLREDDFDADVLVGHRTVKVHFPPEWPGEAIGFFEGTIREMRENPHLEALGGAIIQRETCVAVGGMSFRRHAGSPGTVELGYGINPSYWNRGYATEMARAMVAWARGRPDVDHIVSECLTDNIGSIRVLEKAGFHRTGERDDEEGRLITWEF